MSRVYRWAVHLQTDQGRVTYDKAATEDVDGVRLPSFFVVEWPGLDPQPALTFEAELVDGAYKVVDLRLEAKPGPRGITADDLRNIRLESWLQQLAHHLAVEVEPDGHGGTRAAWTGELSIPARRKVDAVLPKRGRRPLGDDHYRRVARLYVDGGERVEAVADAFDRPFSTAAGWVREARARGILGEKGQPLPHIVEPPEQEVATGGMTVDEFRAWYAQQPGGRELEK